MVVKFKMFAKAAKLLAKQNSEMFPLAFTLIMLMFVWVSL